jgi:hypothetical protein
MLCSLFFSVTIDTAEGSTSLVRYNLNILFMVVYSCKECGELNYLTPHTFWNISDGAKCEKCKTINRITPEDGELKKHQ